MALASHQRLSLRPLALAALLLIVLGLGGWLMTRQGSDRYLAVEGPAEWIVYPAPFNALTYPLAPQSTVFRRTIVLPRVATPATLRVRGFRQVSLAVNGREVPLPRSPANAGDWRTPREIDVAPYLRSGENQFVVEVANDSGPPALWLSLSIGDQQFVSDAAWESSRVGATWLPARSAAQPAPIGPGNLLAGGERTFAALQTHAGTLLLIVVIVAASLAAWATIMRLALRMSPLLTPPRLALGLVSIAWLSLLVFNWQSLPLLLGFDAMEHSDYIDYLQKHHKLPLAYDGFQMHQPPLYYVLCWGLLALHGPGPLLTLLFLLRAFGFIVGLAGIYLLYAGLVRLFPNRPSAQAAGTLLVACLPLQIYMAHYMGNDLLAGTLGTAAVVLTIAVLQDRMHNLRWLAGLGAVLGAGLLTKLTLAPIVAVVLTTLALSAAARDRSLRAVVRGVGVPLVVCLLICGWFFVRNYLQYGRPLLGSFDPESGFYWWQDSGYACADQFLRFGRVLIEPYYAVNQGMLDGLYSTCWGDGDWGARHAASRIPWDYPWMAIGYLLALVPTSLLVLGWLSRLVEWLRRPSAVWGLLLALPVAAFAAMVMQYLSYPYYCHIKASYALPAVFALAAFVAAGFELLSRRSVWIGRILGVLLGTWGVVAFTSFVVNPWSADTLAWKASKTIEQLNPWKAKEYLDQALARDPDHATARTLRGKLLLLDDESPQATEEYRQAADEYRHALRTDPNHCEARLGLATALNRSGDQRAALAELQELIRRCPEYSEAYQPLVTLLAANGDPAGAIAVARAGLRVLPTSVALHGLLARELLKQADVVGAARHYYFARLYGAK